MNDNRTASMLQRVPQILAVTAASYGLSLQERADRPRGGAHQRQRGHASGPHQGAKKQTQAA
jgi:hypothetical protein